LATYSQQKKGYLLLVLPSIFFLGYWVGIAKKLYEKLKVLKSSSLRDFP
jgi:hypothetical protein